MPLKTQAANSAPDSDITWNSYQSTVSTIKSSNFLPINGNSLKLGYAFGIAQDTNGKTNTMQDSYLREPSISGSANNINYSKMNVFLSNNNNYIGSVFQGSYSNSSAETNAQNVSLTSPDFLLIPTNLSTTSHSVTAQNYSILGSNNTNTGLGNTKSYYEGVDQNGNPAYKIEGTFTRGSTNGTGANDFNLHAELILRASPTNSAIVQRELVLKNNTNRIQSFQILFGEDTKLSNNDRVSIKDLGNQSGLFIEDGSYKLMVTNELPDGFNNYSGQAYDSSRMLWDKGFDLKTGAGAESKGYKYGDSVTGDTSIYDSSYSLKWNKTTLAPGETAHYGSTMGVVASPYALPVAKKSYINETTGNSGGTGTNSVGDKLKFSLMVQNNGYGSSWTYEKLNDVIPDGLQINANSIAMTYKNNKNGTETTQQIPASDYDATTKTLTIPPTMSLGDGTQATVTYEANITDAAGGKTITNTGEFTGHDTQTSSKTYKSSVDITVAKPNYSASFTKQIKNITNGETTYSDSTSGQKGDTLEYLITYGVNSESRDSLATGSSISDTLPSGIEQDGNITITASDGAQYGGSLSNVGLGNIAPGKALTVEFKAKVTASSVGNVSNTATFSGGKSSTGQTLGTATSNQAILNVKNINGFESVPSLIDFGTTNLYGKTTTLNNISTVGNLIVNHPTDNNFNISVSYDNNNADTQMKNSDKDTLSDDGSGLLFINQRTSDVSDSGSWKPISSNGTPIRTTDFAGNQESINLTNYVGVGDWKIRLAPDTKVGSYTGTLTWNMVDSLAS